MDSIKQSVINATTGLGLFAIITSGLIATTLILTEEDIAKQVRKAQTRALIQIVPVEQHDNDLLEDTRPLAEGGLLNLPAGKEAYIARVKGEAVAVILPVVATHGYSGPIKMIVGIDTDGKVKGVRVIEHKETPGLGDKIDIKKSAWITAFEGRSLVDPQPEKWKVKKDGGEFDQLTGATITPRAVVAGVHDALLYFSKNRSELIQSATVIDAQPEPDGSTSANKPMKTYPLNAARGESNG